MNKCKKYDNWCEKEKRTCNGCYYNIEDYLKMRISDSKKALDDMIDKRTNTINITGLTRKEVAEITNKRNCLIVQQYCYEEILEYINEEEK